MSLKSSQANRPSSGFFTVTPSNTVVLPDYVRGVRADADGTIVATNSSDVDVTFTVVAGEILPIRPKHIKTSSTATGIVALA